MKDKTPVQLLHNIEQEPSPELFNSILSKELYTILMDINSFLITNGLSLEWRYYNDGKAWLGKVSFKKKTLVWLSVWDMYIKAGFYFTEKTGKGIFDLDIDPELKSAFTEAKPIGKLLPLIVEINNQETLACFKNIALYKISC